MRIPRKLLWLLVVTTPWWGALLMAWKNGTGMLEAIQSFAPLLFVLAPGLLFLATFAAYKLGTVEGEKNFVNKRINERTSHSTSVMCG